MKHKLAILGIVAAGSVLATDSHEGGDDPNTPESLLVRTLEAIRAERMDDALATADSLIEQRPDFRLAHVVRGDILASRTGSVPALTRRSPEMAGMRDEARVRLGRYASQIPRDSLPVWLLDPPSESNTALVVDTRASRLYAFRRENGRWRLVSDHYVSIGQKGADKRTEGDQRTPIGAYLLQARIDSRQIGPYYGIGAWPLDYPSSWDRLRGRDGHGIWIHGTPRDTYSRPPKASNGCVVLANDDLSRLEADFRAGSTPILVVDSMIWASPEEVSHQRQAIASAVNAWRQDWASGSIDRYLAHYSTDFRSERGDINAWENDKRRIASTKRWIQVDVSDLAILKVPGEQNLVMVEFEQDYRSNNLVNQSRKRQYWKLEDGAWHIVWEGAAG